MVASSKPIRIQRTDSNAGRRSRPRRVIRRPERYSPPRFSDSDDEWKHTDPLDDEKTRRAEEELEDEYADASSDDSFVAGDDEYDSTPVESSDDNEEIVDELTESEEDSLDIPLESDEDGGDDNSLDASFGFSDD